ncbi:hypothetical protein SS50377_27483 [Spironucleus salmonicida]|nr:hypothetical protein SS50377_27483 [Spironucleus salmonicida]
MPLYSHTFSWRENQQLTLAISSLSLDSLNFIQIVTFDKISSNFYTIDQYPTHFPQSELDFLPSASLTNTDLLLASSDSIRLFEIKDQKIQLKGVISQSIDDIYPIISAKFNKFDLSKVFSSSSSENLTIFDIVEQKQVQQVKIPGCYKGIFSAKDEILVGGADGVYLWDLRTPSPALLKKTEQDILQVETCQSHMILYIQNQSQMIYSVDRRMPSSVMQGKNHKNQVTGLSASKTINNAFLSSGADGNLFIYEDFQLSKPFLGVKLDCEIESCCWGAGDGKWISCVAANQLKLISLF